ncbi:MAG: hypothetical protein C1943_03820 [Halochromatium sp.]|nr:hypothetical protein [Halochromatium sp.]
MNATTIEIVSLDSLIIDPEIQQRENGLNEAVLVEYRALIDHSPEWPFDPITVFRGPDGLIVADGFHRCSAAHHTARFKIPAEIIEGTRRDAMLHAVGANATHGLQRTPADKRRAVLTLLTDAEWATRSDRWIARTANVSQPFVGKVRREVELITLSVGQKVTSSDDEQPDWSKSDQLKALSVGQKVTSSDDEQPDWSKSDQLITLSVGQKVTNPVSPGHVSTWTVGQKVTSSDDEQPDWSKSDQLITLSVGQKVTNPDGETEPEPRPAPAPAPASAPRVGYDGKTRPATSRRKRSSTASTESAPIPTERRTPQDPSPGKLTADFLLVTGAKIRYLTANRSAVERYPDAAPQLVLAMEEILTWLRPLVAHRLDSEDRENTEGWVND